MSFLRRFALVAALLPAVALTAAAQWTSVLDTVRAHPLLACGPDLLYDFDVPAPAPAPAGYEAVYISHYGRHGSRYAYTSKTYLVVRELLSRAAETGNLTPYGEEVWRTFQPFFARVEHRVGDLTRKGWDQQQGIARVMYRNFRTAVPAGARVDACVSPSFRSALSMTSCCLALGQLQPDLKIYEHQSLEDLPATRPNMGNPFAPESLAPPCPCTETPEDFLLRTLDWKRVLGRLFRDPEAAIGKYTPFQAMDYFYMLVAGLQSLDADLQPDWSGIFPGEDFVRMWEVDNYLRFREYYVYLAPCCQIFQDMIDKADLRLSAGERGADLRFGHDHCLETLLMIARMAGFGTFPDKAEELAWHFQTFRSPMSANIQFIFYRPASKTDLRPVLVRVQLNGRDVADLGGGDLPEGPFYDWEALKEYLLCRFTLFMK